MGPKTILVCLTTPENTETLMKAAVPLARKHGAHLIGLHTVEALLVYPGIAMHIPEPAFATFNASQKMESEAIKAVFEKHTKNEDFVSEFRLIRAEAVSAVDRMVECARAADLVIMSHEDKEHDRYDQRNAQTQVIRESGRPVIVVPLEYDGPEIGANLLLGWSDTREAARAAHDLLWIADAGATLTVLRVVKAQQDALHVLLQKKFAVNHIFRSGLPPMGQFPLLPQPLRFILGADAAALDATLAKICQTSSRPVRQTYQNRQRLSGAKQCATLLT